MKIKDFDDIKKINFDSISKDKLLDFLKQHHDDLLITKGDIVYREGYSNKDGDSYFNVPRIGVRIADSINLYTFYHEYSHMIECIDDDPERILQPTFGLGYTTKVKVFDKEYENPVTYQGVQREIRVLAIQAKLMAHHLNIDEEAIIDFFIEDSISSLRMMNDFRNIPINESVPHAEKEKLRLFIIAEEFRDFYATLDINEIIKKAKKVRHVRDIERWPLDDISGEILSAINYRASLPEAHKSFRSM